ncbi:hypothetical protein [[Scytonema hofmanni] UTEX B 1581]|uniref:hypothetical protein n=1 Tax=[Scytonema hofmanni] UTEX B 1581 TaxID=379535 RepID=UPI0016416622|nr:hypothetical protein [[Scytonema hofmanni] UTEX B 1581]
MQCKDVPPERLYNIAERLYNIAERLYLKPTDVAVLRLYIVYEMVLYEIIFKALP